VSGRRQVSLDAVDATCTAVALSSIEEGCAARLRR
jgi:hypothetical protein